MNQDQVKNILLSLEEPASDFTLLFTGKKSKLVNGLYKPMSQEILIHNKNFETENQLLYTAIHEYAHHLYYEKYPYQDGKRAHTIEFWAIFHSLLDKAEEKKVYKNIFDSEEEFIKLSAEIKSLLPENGSIMLKLGRLLAQGVDLCKKHAVRFEDYMDRTLVLPRSSANLAMKAFHLDLPDEIGWDAMKVLARARKPEAINMALEAFRAGKSQDSVRSLLKTQAASREDPLDSLNREKKRIERAISTMQNRLKNIEEQIESMHEKA